MDRSKAEIHQSAIERSPVVDELVSILGSSKVILGEEITERIPHIWRFNESIQARAICLPSSAEDVAAICALCHQNDQTIVIHGGLTNLVRSTESLGDDVVVSLERMNKILEIDSLSRTMTVESGAILEDIQMAAKNEGLLFPLNFGAKGSCQIGGCISTNAGGLRVVKYGMTRNLILGLECVLADGTILSSLHKILKNNSAYDLKQLFIGSEGTLGIVTKAVLRLYENPQSRNSAYVGFNDFKKVLQFLKFVDAKLGGGLSAFEIFWKNTYKALSRPESGYQPPLPYDFKYYVLYEGLGGHPEEDNRLFQAVLEEAWEQDLILDAAIANSDTDLALFWNIREDVGNLLSLFKYRQDFDISLSVDKMEEYIKTVHHRLKQELDIDQCYTFGHLADGNIHFIIGKDSADPELTDKINNLVYAPLRKIKGSVSAEHGIGLDKKAFLSISRTDNEIEAMKTLKKTLDPKNILNPGKIFDL